MTTIHFMYGGEDLFSLEAAFAPQPGDVVQHEVLSNEDPVRVVTRWRVIDAQREWHTVHNRPAYDPERARPRVQYVIVKVEPAL